MRVIDETTLRISFPSNPRQMYVFLPSIVVMSMICTHFMREMKEQRGKQMYVFLPSIKVGGRAACYVEL